MTDQHLHNTSYNWRLIAAGFICLFAGAFYDIIRGPLLPSLGRELGLDFADAGSFLGLGSFAAGFATILMIWLNNRFSSEQVVIMLAVLGGIVCALAPMVTNFPMLIVLAVCSGALVSMLGSLANILVVGGTPQARQGRMLSALHTMYGLGAAFASWSVGAALSSGIRWWVLFTACLPLFLALYPLARRTGHAIATPAARFQSPRLFGFQYLAILIFCLYVSGEVTTSMWMTTWLMNVKGFSLEDATLVLSAYFVVLLAGRMACATFMTPEREKPVLLASLIVPPALMYLILGEHIGPWSFVLIGLYGPFFPVFLARVSRQSPTNWRSLTIWAIVAMNFLLAAGQLFLGKIADSFGIARAFYLPAVALTCAFAAISTYFLLESKLSARDRRARAS
jgi:fucose permease